MQILYAIQATGNGHISRAIELMPFIQQYGNVDVFLSGSNSSLPMPFPVKYKSNGLSLFYGNTGGLDYFKIAKAFELYGNDPYFRNADEGEWVGEVLVYPNGELFARRMKHSAYDIKQNDLGGRGESGSYKNLGIFRAYQGADQPNQVRTSYAKTISMGKNAEEEIQFSEELPQGVSLENGATTITFGLPKPGSPASDAAIKAYILQADDIIDYVTIKDPNYNAYTAHDDAADIAKEKTADKNQYKFGKLDKEKEMAANVQKDRTLVDPSKETGAERKARMDAEREKKRQELRAKRGL
jgi:hypothetical protein